MTLLDGFGLQASVADPRAAPDDLPLAVQRLVAHLCLSGRSPRSALAGKLWPDVTERRAHGSLRSALWRLQKAVPGLVLTCGTHLTLADRVQVDIHELGHWAKRACDPSASLEDVQAPAATLRGELLPGWYDDWVLLERERLRYMRLRALEQVAERLLTAGSYGDALETAYAAIHCEPLRESAHRIIIRVHLAEGNVAEALRTFKQFRMLLADELGVAPTEQMTRLLAAVRLPPQRGLPAERTSLTSVR